MKTLPQFIQESLTAYHACDLLKEALLEKGFVQLHETADWNVSEGGKYYIVRGGSIIAFTIDSLDDFSYKIVTSHPDSPALKIKEKLSMKITEIESIAADTAREIPLYAGP